MLAETQDLFQRLVDGGTSELILLGVAGILTALLRRSGKSKAEIGRALQRLQSVRSSLEGVGTEQERVDALAEYIVTTFEKDPEARRVIKAAFERAEERFQPAQWLEFVERVSADARAKVNPPGDAAPDG